MLTNKLYVMKVLWFSNCVIGGRESTGSGSWLFGMKDIISNHVELYNITKSNVSEITLNEYKDIIEYIIPNYKLHNGLPNKANIKKIQQIVNDINPDVIQIWGLEMYWGLLFTRNLIKGNYIIEVQGLLSSCYNVYYGGLTPMEIIKCFNIKEILKLNSYLPFKKINYLKGSKTEHEIFSNSKFISTQSEWTRYQIKFKTNKGVYLFKTYRPIRKIFYSSEKWNKIRNSKSIVIFSSISYLEPFKGFHILLKALNILKSKYNNIIINIAGINIEQIVFYKKGGYAKYLESLIKKYELKNNIKFVGNLDEVEICEQLLKSDVYVNPSFVESYSAASAEALYLGVPSVLSYAGAMPNFSNIKEVALYYSPLDFIDLASKIDNLIINDELSKLLSNNSISIMKYFCDQETIKQTQLSIYKKVINHS